MEKTAGYSQLEQFWSQQSSILYGLLDEIVPPKSKVVYFDFPVHKNVGDLLIYLGTENWLRNRDFEVLGRYPIGKLPKQTISTDTILLCHGGGNFGDLYRHQSFREEIVNRFPKNKIIFLPQSIFYTNKENLDTASSILNRHRNLHLLVRDNSSLNIAKTAFPQCRSYLMPDMAAFLFPLEETLLFKKPRTEAGAVLYLLRQDIEAKEQQMPPGLPTGWQGDWSDMFRYEHLVLGLLQLVHRHLGPWVPAKLFAGLWYSVARKTALNCAARFAAAEMIVTSRLHGHILASLLGVPNVLLDNNYGKNSTYYETWQSKLPLARMFRGDTKEAD